MSDNTRGQLTDLLGLSEHELLLQVGMIVGHTEGLAAPDELARRAQALIDKIKPALADRCCGLLRTFSGPELDLACAVAAVLAGNHGLPLAAALAAYIVKRGAKWLCEGSRP